MCRRCGCNLCIKWILSVNFKTVARTIRAIINFIFCRLRARSGSVSIALHTYLLSLCWSGNSTKTRAHRLKRVYRSISAKIRRYEWYDIAALTNRPILMNTTRVAISRFPYIFRKLSTNIICARVWLFVTIVYRGHIRYLIKKKSLFIGDVKKQ